MLAQGSRSTRTWSALAALALIAGGCGSSHVREDPGVDAGPDPEPDAGIVVDDAGPIVEDAGPITGVCAISDRRVSVEVEPITTIRPERCDFMHLESAMLYAVEPAVDRDGIRLSVDLCPFADDDCRCAVIVSGVGADLAGHVRTGDMVRGRIDAQLVHLEDAQAVCLDCEGCPCNPARLVFYAADGYPDAAPAAPAAVTFASGTESCRRDARDPGECSSVRHRVRMTESLGEVAPATETVEADEGQQGYLARPGVWLRTLRSSRTDCPAFAHIPPEPGPRAAWVAWSEPLATRGDPP